MEIPSKDSSKRELEDSSESTIKRAKTEVDSVTETLPKKSIEDIVGIRSFRTSTPGFSAIFKQRFSDFLVNEVDEDGNVIRLTDLKSVPPPPPKQTDEKEIIQLIGEEQFNKLKEFATAAEKPKGATFIIPNITEKEKRTKVHQAIRELFTGVSSETLNADISVFYGKGKFGARAEWPKEQPEYLQFHLFKENKETTEAFNILCGLIKMSNKTFAMAGTKDKRGVTCQRVTAFKVTAERMRELNNKLKGIRVGNFKYVPKQLTLGDLYGNRFNIILRDVSAEDAILRQALTELGENGFYNYYGLQRFGTRNVLTHEVGIQLLAGNWQRACELILNPQPVDPPQIQEIRSLWRTDPKKALELLPKFLAIERYVLLGFAKNDFSQNACLNAIQNLPRTMRTMYVHAFQSFVWNHMLSERMEKFGNAPVKGDFVFAGKEVSKNKEEEPTNEEEMLPDEEAVEEKMQIKELTEEEAKSGKFTMFDVVLPIPGHSVKYPPHLEPLYGNFMKQYGVDIKNMKRGVKDFSLPGGYRKIVEKVEGLNWEIIRYDDFKNELMLTDLAHLEGKHLVTTPEGKHTALRVEFTLRSSSYATMAIREILKSSTSGEFQKTLNDAFVVKDQQ